MSIENKILNGKTLEIIKEYVDGKDNEKVNKVTKIIAGNGLSGGGELNGDVTINITPGTDSIVVNENAIAVNVVDSLSSNSTTRPASANSVRVVSTNLNNFKNFSEYSLYNGKLSEVPPEYKKDKFIDTLEELRKNKILPKIFYILPKDYEDLNKTLGEVSNNRIEISIIYFGEYGLKALANIGEKKYALTSWNNTEGNLITATLLGQESLSGNFAGTLNNNQTKEVGKTYYDFNTNKVYICTTQTTINTADARYFRNITNSKIDENFLNLFNNVVTTELISNISLIPKNSQKNIYTCKHEGIAILSLNYLVARGVSGTDAGTIRVGGKNISFLPALNTGIMISEDKNPISTVCIFRVKKDDVITIVTREQPLDFADCLNVLTIYN